MVIVQGFRAAVSGRPEGLHYLRRFLSHAVNACTTSVFAMRQPTFLSVGGAALRQYLYY
jgi:hypothetical protein